MGHIGLPLARLLAVHSACAASSSPASVCASDSVLSPRSSWFAPVHALAAWLMPSRSRLHPVRRTQGSTSLAVATGAAAASTVAKITCHRPAPAPCKLQTVSRLKIVREFDSTMSPSSAGRMMISGRMADVCAELDRLAQLESAGQLELGAR